MARNIINPIGLTINLLNGAEFQQKYGMLTDPAAQINGIQLYGRPQIAYNAQQPRVSDHDRPDAGVSAARVPFAAGPTDDGTDARVSQIQQGATFLSLISNFISRRASLG